VTVPRSTLRDTLLTDATRSVDAVFARLDRARREHLKVEIALRWMGRLWMLTAGVGLIGAAGAPYLAGTIHTSWLAPFAGGLAWLASVLVAVFSALLLRAGWQLHRLEAVNRRLCTLCATVMAFTFPGGSVLGGAALALMLSRKGKVVLAKGYKRVVSATPHLSTWRLRPLFGGAS